MKLLRTALIAGVLTMSVTAVALAGGKPETVPPTHEPANNGGQSNGPNYQPTTGPKEGLPEQAKAWGRICKEEGRSKHHQEGEKGTEFSRCVTDLAKAAHHPNMAPGRVCKGRSKTHNKGEESEFRQCIKQVRTLRREERENKS
jgi:hypothetical protein